MPRRGPYAQTALFVVTTPADWKPMRPWTVPPSFTDGKLFKAHLCVHEARQFCRLFNARQVDLCCRHEWDHQWMIVSSCCRQSHSWDGDKQPEAVEGGAT